MEFLNALSSRALSPDYRVNCYSTQALGRALRRISPSLPCRSFLAIPSCTFWDTYACTYVSFIRDRRLRSTSPFESKCQFPHAYFSLFLCLIPSLSSCSPLFSRLFLSLGSTLSPSYPASESRLLDLPFLLLLLLLSTSPLG